MLTVLFSTYESLQQNAIRREAIALTAQQIQYFLMVVLVLGWSMKYGRNGHSKSEWSRAHRRKPNGMKSDNADVHLIDAFPCGIAIAIEISCKSNWRHLSSIFLLPFFLFANRRNAGVFPFAHVMCLGWTKLVCFGVSCCSTICYGSV